MQLPLYVRMPLCVWFATKLAWAPCGMQHMTQKNKSTAENSDTSLCVNVGMYLGRNVR